jgi:hypothetical protein
MKRPSLTRALVVAAILAAAGLAGGACSRPHLNPNYAQSYNSWFIAQHGEARSSNPALARKTLEDLDAQEAAAVSASYRKGVARGDATAGQSQILMVAPTRGGGAEGYLPPPSVPTGQ